jgi:hypothetical protein
MTETFTLAGLAAVNAETCESTRIAQFYFVECYSFLSISDYQYREMRTLVLHQHPQLSDIITDLDLII